MGPLELFDIISTYCLQKGYIKPLVNLQDINDNANKLKLTIAPDGVSYDKLVVTTGTETLYRAIIYRQNTLAFCGGVVIGGVEVHYNNQRSKYGTFMVLLSILLNAFSNKSLAIFTFNYTQNHFGNSMIKRLENAGVKIIKHCSRNANTSNDMTYVMADHIDLSKRIQTKRVSYSSKNSREAAIEHIYVFIDNFFNLKNNKKNVATTKEAEVI